MSRKEQEVVNIAEAFARTQMSYDDIILWAERMKREDEATVSVYEEVRGWPLDGAYALIKAAKELFGWTETRGTMGMFGMVPATEVALEVEYGKYVKVPWGGLGLPGIEGTLECGSGEVDGMPCFVLKGEIKKKGLGKVTALMQRTREIVREESIYKGKALVVQPIPWPAKNPQKMTILAEPPKFFALNGLTKKDLVLPKHTMEAVETAVFSAIEDVELIRQDGLPTKRTTVLDGEPGTGKTLTMTIAAKLCTQMGRTFILLKDVRFLEDAIKMAARFNLSPAMISAEDIDRCMFERTDEANMLLNAIDGVDSKNLDILFLLTTNCKDRLIDTFKRAGRSDWIITLPVPDTEAAAELLKRYATANFQLSDVDYLRVGKVLAEAKTLPSNIAEVARRSRYFRIAKKSSVIDADMLMSTAVQVVEEKKDNRVEVKKPDGIVERIAAACGVPAGTAEASQAVN